MKDEALRLALEALESHIVWFSRDTMIGKAMRKKAEDSIAAIKQALEQPEPEPVAWAGVDFDIKTSPPKREWQGLTDDEVSKLIDNEIGFNSCCGWEEEYTRAVEAKLKEKNT